MHEGVIVLLGLQDIASVLGDRECGLSVDNPPSFVLLKGDDKERGPWFVIRTVSAAEAVGPCDDGGLRREHSHSLSFDLHDCADLTAASAREVLAKFRAPDEWFRRARRDILSSGRVIRQKRFQIAGAELLCNLWNNGLGGTRARWTRGDFGATYKRC